MHGPLRPPPPPAAAEQIFSAAQQALLPRLETGRPMDRKTVQTAMTAAFGGTDAAGAWSWKQAYDAAEIALTLFLQRYGPAMLSKAGSPARMLGLVEKLTALEPAQTRRDDVQQRYQQFSTPLAIACTVAAAAAARPDDVVLEPSAGTGTLAVLSTLALDPAAGGRLALNELTATRAGLLQLAFPAVDVTRHDAEHIADTLPNLDPSLVVMNPPFSRSAGRTTVQSDTDVRHVHAAYRALRPGGRLVAITSPECTHATSGWRVTLGRCEPPPDVLFTAPIAGKLYQSRGTTYETRLTVIEKPAPTDPRPPAEPRHSRTDPIDTAAALLDETIGRLPARRTTPAVRKARTAGQTAQPPPSAAPKRKRRRKARPAPDPPPQHDWGHVKQVGYHGAPPAHNGDSADHDRPYHLWTPSVVRIAGARPHPTTLVQSAAMSAVQHRIPTARPKLPRSVVTEGKLSDAQLESVVLAADAHTRDLPGLYHIDSSFELIRPAGVDPPPRDENTESTTVWSKPVRVRAGWMLGDGTGTGKGRQVAGVILDQWLQGNRRALWLSASDKLLEDARRDWTALGGREDDVVPLGTWRQKDPVDRNAGILFSTYATLRSPSRNGNQSRLEQIVAWLAGGDTERTRHAWDGVIVFDESHAMSNAAGGRGKRGPIAPSQQGKAGVQLQNALPQARILYVSATGASTVDGLCYAHRLGLWATPDTPFVTRADFVEAMESGGVAALEVVGRDLKALGCYQARALSYSGVEVNILEHVLTDEQRNIYDEYADAFRIIHHNLDAALKATGIDADDVCNARAKAAARSAFESAKQRFFSHLLTSMKCPSLIDAIQRDLDNDRAPVVQIVSTGEALTERRIAQIPPSEWNDLNVDLTPREYVIDYLLHAFPTQLHEVYEDDEGIPSTRPKFDPDGNPVVSQEALALRDALVERLGALPPVGSALDQLLHHFGHAQIAEISGRTRRVLRLHNAGGGDRLALRPRAPSANLQETEAFMSGIKPVLVFSKAGNTGRSYHSDISCGNTRRRIHYLLEAGWTANEAVQGLGRTHRTRQKTAPLFRPVTTNVKGERRFTSTIARRIHSLGAITRGQKDSQSAMGDDNTTLFRESDNFESPYAVAALRMFYLNVCGAHVPNWSLQRFQNETGLRLTDSDGAILSDLPPMSTFLNRLLALRIDDQNELFAHLEELIDGNIQDAVDSGTYNHGVERITAAGLKIVSSETARTNGHETNLIEIERRDRVKPTPLDYVLQIYEHATLHRHEPLLLWNHRSKHPALCTRAPSITLEDGTVQPRRRLIQPGSQRTIPLAALNQDNAGWRPVEMDEWRQAWRETCDAMPEFHESRIWLATGVLLPIWNKLPDTDVKVYRLTTDDGRDLIGRLLTPGHVENVRMKLGLDVTAAGNITPAERMEELLARRCRYLLDGDLVLAGRRHMGLMRVEIEHRDPAAIGELKRLGCRTEIVQYRTRVFVPDPATLGRVLTAHPIEVRHTVSDR